MADTKSANASLSKSEKTVDIQEKSVGLLENSVGGAQAASVNVSSSGAAENEASTSGTISQSDKDVSDKLRKGEPGDDDQTEGDQQTESFDSFYKELTPLADPFHLGPPMAEPVVSHTRVKEIEQRDSVLTPKQQIDRLLRPGATYFNLNPYDVLDLPYDATMAEIKQKYRRMSILVHPDKNRDDAERAQKAFDSVNKAYKTLENEEGFKRCQEIVEEAKLKTDELVAKKKKQLKKEGKGEQVVPEESDPEKYKHAVYVHMCKLFADLERLRIEKEAKEQHEKKRKAQEEEEEKEQAKIQKEWNKNFEESRTGRVDSWRSFNKSKGKKAKGVFRPPKPKLEKR